MATTLSSKGPELCRYTAFLHLQVALHPTNSSDHGCGPSITYTHINLEVWTDTYREIWDEIQAKYPNMAPKKLRKFRYYGASAMFVPSAVQERAYEAEGSNLDFYRDYNVTWNNPSRYFTSQLTLMCPNFVHAQTQH